MKRHYCQRIQYYGFTVLLGIFMLVAPFVKGQDIRNYTTQIDTTGSLGYDLNKNVIDMSNAKILFSLGAGRGNTSITLPFNMAALSHPLSQFLVTDLGFVMASPPSPSTVTVSFAAPQQLSTFIYSDNVMFAPFSSYYLGVDTPGILYKVFGSFPSRVAVIEYNCLFPYSTSTVPGTSAKVKFQLRIYEGTSTIEYVYGQMNAGAWSGAPAVSAAVGLSTGIASSNNTFIGLTRFDSLIGLNSISSKLATTNVNVGTQKQTTLGRLNSASEGHRAVIRFTPPQNNAPTNLKALNQTRTQATLYWDDNSTDETGFILYKSVNGNPYYVVATTAPNINYFLDTLIVPSTNYSYRVEVLGTYSCPYNAKILRFKTGKPDLNTANRSGRWKDPKTWSAGHKPYPTDSVVIPSGTTIILDTAGYANNINLSGTLKYQDTLTASLSLNINSDVYIGSTGKLTAAINPQKSNTNHQLYIGRSLINDDTLDLYTNNGSILSAITLHFMYIGNGTFSGKGTVTDIYQMELIKFQNSDTIVMAPNVLTVKGTSTDAAAGTGFLLGNPASYKGTLRIGGTFTLDNRLRILYAGSTDFVMPGSGLILENPNFNITGSVGNIQVGVNSTFIIRKGTWNVFQNTNVYYLYLKAGCTLQIEGGLVVVNGYFVESEAGNYIQRGGKVVLNGAMQFTVATAVSEMSGGTIVFSGKFGGNAAQSSILATTPAYTNFQIGSALTPTISNFTAGFYGNFPNLYLDSTINTSRSINLSLTGITSVYGRLLVPDNDQLTLNSGSNLYFYGDSMFVKNKLSTVVPASIIGFYGNKRQVVSGNTHGSVWSTIDINNSFLRDSAVIFNFPDSVVCTKLMMKRGNLIHADKITLGDAINNVDVQIGGAGFKAGKLDAAPHINLGSLLYTLEYLSDPEVRISGYEIPVKRVVHNFNMNNPLGKLIIRKGAVTIPGTLTLGAGIIHADTSNSLILTDSFSTSGITGGGATSYVQGVLERYVSPLLTGVKNYNFPVGDSLIYRPLNLVAPVTGLRGKVDIYVQLGDSGIHGIGNGKLYRIDSNSYWKAYFKGKMGNLLAGKFQVPYTNTYVRLRIGKASTTARRAASNLTFTEIGKKFDDNTLQTDDFTTAFDTLKPVNFLALSYYKLDTLKPGTYYVGKGRDYLNLTAVAEALSSSILKDRVYFRMTKDYDPTTELFPISFDPITYKNNIPHKATIGLAPDVYNITTGNTATLAANIAMIRFNGVDSLDIDGQGYDLLGKPTGTREWTFSTATNSTSSPIFSLVKDASYNILENTKLSGSLTLTTLGLVQFDAGLKTGNNYNIIRGNLFSSPATGPFTPTYLNSSPLTTPTPIPNQFNEIRNNEFVNFTFKAIQAANYSNGWTIAGNHIYQTSTTIAYTAGMTGIDYEPLYGTDNSTIDGNYFGGTTTFAGGTTPWTSTSTTPITAINVRTNNVGLTMVKNNVIKNITLSNNSTALYMWGIETMDGNITVANNKIGGPNATDKITSYSQGTNRFIYIASGNGQKTITNNEISNIEMMTTGYAGNITHCIMSAAATPTQPTVIISNNYIHDVKATGTANVWNNSSFNAIYLGANQLHNITGNTIANLTQKDNGAIMGIAAYQVGTTGFSIIDGNTVYGLNRTSATGATTVGIYGYVGYFQFSNNMVYLSNTGNETKPTDMSGLFVPGYSTYTRKVFNNTIYLGGYTTGLTTAGNSYAFNYGSTTADSIWNNIFINTRYRSTTGTDIHYAAYFPSTAYTTNNQLDFNSYYGATPANLIYLGAAYTFATYKSLIGGREKNSFTGYLPKFNNTSIGDLHLVNDTANAYFKATGRGTRSVAYDFDADTRNSLQPDLGADEFVYSAMPKSPLLVAKPDTACPGDTIVMKLFNPNSKGKVEWFSSSAGGDTLATGATYRPVINTSTTYYAQIRDNRIHSYRIALSVFARTVPAISVSNVPANKLCKGSTVNLQASGWTGATYYWYNVAKGGTSIATGSSFSSGSLRKDTIFYLEAHGPLGCKTARKVINISVDTGNVLTSPSVTAVAPVCQGQSVVLIGLSTGTIRWYATMNSTTALFQGTAFTSGVLSHDTTFYTDANNGTCYSTRVPVSVHVYPLPIVPSIATANYVCSGNAVVLANKDSSVLNWYASDTASKTFLIGKQFSIASVNKDSTVYVSFSNGNCESKRIAVNIYKRNLPDTPYINYPAAVCYGQPAMLNASLASYKINWYANANSTISLKQDTQFVTGPLTHDSTFYVEANDGNCGTRVPVKIKVYAKSIAPVIVSIDSVCYGGNGYIKANSNGQIRWFDAMNGGSMIDTGTLFKIQGISSDTMFYADNMTNSGCISQRIVVPVKLRKRPNPPVLVPMSLVCQGDKAMLVAVSGDSVKWYNSSVSQVPFSTKDTLYTPALQANTTYYMEASHGACTSIRVPVAVTVHGHPTEPGFSTDFRTCSSNSIRLNTDNNQVAKWYTTATSQKSISTDSIFYTGILSHDTTFYAEAYDGYCSSSLRVKVPVTVIQFTKGLKLMAQDTVVKPNQNDTISILGDVANAYSWDFGTDANVTSASGVGPFNIHWTSPGSKAVTVYVHRKSGETVCDTTIIRTVTVLNTSGIVTVQGNQNTLEVFPNPMEDQLHVKINLDKQQRTIIKLSSVDGKVLMEEKLPLATSMEKTYDVSKLAKGIYIISIETKESVIRKQIIVQ